MTEIEKNTLEIEQSESRGKRVVGEVWHKIDEYWITGSVEQYNYDSDKTNYVPIVTVLKEDGSVIKEPTLYDTHNPSVAKRRVKKMVEHMIKEVQSDDYKLR